MTIDQTAATTSDTDAIRINLVNLIDGQERPASSGATLPIIDPGTGEEIGRIPDSTAEDVDLAVRTAQRAFEDGRWSDLDPEQRQRILFALADRIEQDAERLTRLEALDTGKPIAEAELDIAEAAAVVRYFAGWADKIGGEILPAPSRFFAATLRQPVGVCAAITPWNYPLPILTYKVAPALAFGNTVVAKPSENASITTVEFARLALEVGVPAGVLNVVLGAGTAGSALAGHPDIDKIAFTGSTRTGRAVLHASADTITPATVELGGKSAQVIFADADIEAAADGVAGGIWTHAGQICIAGSRVLVEDSVAQQFLSALMRRAAALVPGHSTDPASTLGPVISARQQHDVERAVHQAEYDGAGVYQPDHPLPSGGFFVHPTIISDVPDEHPVVQEEIFGPVVVVQTFRSEDEAVRRANGTPYGLAAGLWTADSSRIRRVSRRLESGTVWVNGYGAFHPTLPFGGVKASGFGRELGAEAIAYYTHNKTVVETIAP